MIGRAKAGLVFRLLAWYERAAVIVSQASDRTRQAEVMIRRALSWGSSSLERRIQIGHLCLERTVKKQVV